MTAPTEPDDRYLSLTADVRCAACEAPIDESPDLLPRDRKPCPACGDMDRSIRAYMAGHIAVSFSASGTLSALESFPSLPDLLLQSVILIADKTQEGRLVAAVAQPWFDIIALLKNDPAVAFQIPAEKWEEIIAGSYRKAGFTEVTLTPRSGDHGRDVIAVMRGIGSVRVIDQVKAYKPGHRVTANDVRAFCFVVYADNADKGFMTTTSDFAPRISHDPLLRKAIPDRVELINGKDLLARLKILASQSGIQER